MRSYFPFTDYDFYGYIASGFFILLAVDYAVTGGDLLLRDQWTFIEIVIAVALAYVTGHLAALPSSLLLEHGFARRFLSPPIAVQLGLATPNKFERFVGRYLIGRYYEPLPIDLRTRLLKMVGEELGTPDSEITDSESVFHVAYKLARSSDDTRTRMDDFRNQYGFTRNMAFASLFAAAVLGIGMMIHTVEHGSAFATFALIMGVGMLLRFLKFYASFANEVVRGLLNKA